MATIGFIGTGIMGRAMAGHLLAAGHALHVFNRTRAKAQSLVEHGATWHDTPGDVAAGQGVVDRARPGSLIVDMTTSSPMLAERMAAAAATRGLTALDAPVTGGDVGARNASLVIMAGGDAAAFDQAKLILDLLGKSVTHLGPAGAGQRCKLANQVAVAIGMVAWCEALAHARAGGLDPAAVQQVIAGGAAGSWALTNLAPRALAGDFAPGFMVKHLLKDLAIARECAAATKTDLPGLSTAERLFQIAAELGWADDGTQVLYRMYAEAINPRKESWV